MMTPKPLLFPTFILIVIILLSITVEIQAQWEGLPYGKIPEKSKPPAITGSTINNNCYIPKGRTSCAPQYIISGTVKSGASKLHDYLLAHPKVLPMVPSATLNGKSVLANKESRFWMDPIFSSLVSLKGKENALNEYLDLFYPISVSDPYFHGKENEYVDYITGEISPMYVNQPGVALRIQTSLPKIKVIVMLRNPIDRAYSEYWFKEKIRGGEKDKEEMRSTIQRCLLYEKNLYESCDVDNYARNHPVNSPSDLFHCVLALHQRTSASGGGKSSDVCPINNIKFSLYPIILHDWVQQFGLNLLVIKSEDFFKDPIQHMKIVSRFLGIDDVEIEWKQIVDSNVEYQSDYLEMEESVRTELANFFEPINEDLAELLNKPVFWDFNSKKGE